MKWEWTNQTLTEVEQFLAEKGLASGTLSVTPIGDGHSNLTYHISDGRNELVLRRPPPPPLPPGGHDVLREARIMKALEGSGLPVPRVLATSEAGSILDVPFYVMNFIPGIIFTDKTPAAFSEPASRRAVAESMIDRLADLHSVDWENLGLQDFGRPEGFNHRHLRRIGSLIFDQNNDEADDNFADIYTWLEERIPAEAGHCIVHNDYRLGNIMWSGSAPVKILAILDWELATLGDPLLDLGYFLASYPQKGENLTPVQDFAHAVLEPGYPSRDELITRYQKSTGRDLSCLKWYMVMANWKLAVLYEYSRRRGEDPYYQAPGLVNRFLASARSLCRKI